MAKTVVLVAFEVKADKMECFLEIIRDHAAGTLTEEPGCERFDVMTSRDRTNAVHLHEVYADDEAYELHARSSRLANVRERYKDLIVGRTITICNL